MINVRNQKLAKCVVYEGNFLLFYSAAKKFTSMLYFMAKKEIFTKTQVFQLCCTFPKALLPRQDNINVLTATVKPGQGHHKYRVTFTVRIPLDSYE